MSKKEEFKNFIKSKPELVEYIKNKDMTMQAFYELYDVYGEDEDAWKPYERTSNMSVGKISNILKNINLDELQKQINNAQKAIDVVGELTSKDSTVKEVVKPLASRPLNKFFED